MLETKELSIGDGATLVELFETVLPGFEAALPDDGDHPWGLLPFTDDNQLR